MQIRAVTLGLSVLPTARRIFEAGKQLKALVAWFNARGFVVQSRRLALPSWDRGTATVPVHDRVAWARDLDALCAENGIDFCSLGVARDPPDVASLAGLLVTTSRLSGGVDAADARRGIDFAAVESAARAVRHLSENSEDGFGNFRFGTGFSIAPDLPYFPCAYHAGDSDCFSVGLENSDVVVSAFRRARSVTIAAEALHTELSEVVTRVESACLQFEQQDTLRFAGIDTSITPSLDAAGSIVGAFEGLGVSFARSGSMTVCGLITRTVKNLLVRRVGYCGLMLPVLEDQGLSKLADAGQFEISDLLRLSSVCAVGVDMVPLPGSASTKALVRLMMDMATQSIALSKPLCCRVLPIPGKRAGDLTTFSSPYLCNCRIFNFESD